MDKREQILNTSLKLFVENGFHATPTSMIAKEAEVATGTLFHHFKTKEELINTLYLETKDSLINGIAEGVEEIASIKGKLRRIWSNLMAWSIDHQLEIIFFRLYSNSPFIDDLTRQKGNERFTFLFELIKQGQGEEVLKEMPVGLMIEILNGILFGTVSYYMNNRENWTDDDMEISFKAFWDCLRE